MSETVRKLLDLDRCITRLRDQRLEAEARGDTVAAAAADHEQRNLDHARQWLRARATDEELNEYEEARQMGKVSG